MRFGDLYLSNLMGDEQRANAKQTNVISTRFWRDLPAGPRRCRKDEHSLSAARYLRVFSRLACGYLGLRQCRLAFS